MSLKAGFEMKKPCLLLVCSVFVSLFHGDMSFVVFASVSPCRLLTAMSVPILNSDTSGPRSQDRLSHA